MIELLFPDVMLAAQSAGLPEDHWIGQLQRWTDSLPEALQWLGIIAISAIPFVESYFGAPVGVIVGLHPAVAVATATVGNMLSLAVVVYLAHWVRTAILHRRDPDRAAVESPKRERVRKIFDRFGIPGVSILGPLALPSQITAPLMVSFGADRRAVMAWMLVSVVLWGTGFALLGVGLLTLIA